MSDEWIEDADDCGPRNGGHCDHWWNLARCHWCGLATPQGERVGACLAAVPDVQEGER